jgi:hypothetical protein
MELLTRKGISKDDEGTYSGGYYTGLYFYIMP